MRHKAFRSSSMVCVLSLGLAVPQGVFIGAQAQPAVQAKPAAPAGDSAPPVGTNADTGWPRTLALKSGSAIWYQPQIESWTGQSQLVAWSAVSYQPTGAKEPALGTIKIEGPTSVSLDERVASLDLRITEYNFKSLSPDQIKTTGRRGAGAPTERARDRSGSRARVCECQPVTSPQ